jgi:hypothetical protein
MFDQVVANLRELREAMRCATGDSAGVLQAQAVQSWTDGIDTAIADLLEVERRARYAEVLAVGAALVDVTIEGPANPRGHVTNRSPVPSYCWTQKE